MQNSQQKIRFLFYPLTTSVHHRTETIQLVCIANQLAGFYIMGGKQSAFFSKVADVGIFTTKQKFKHVPVKLFRAETKSQSN